MKSVNPLIRYALKWNPFLSSLPVEALYVSPAVEHFCTRVVQGLVREGGFALISGDPGTGKSVTLRLLAERLQQSHDLSVAALVHPSANLADFYREMGDLFAVELRPHNRWGGFKVLRERWLTHLDSTLLRPVLLIDEAQEMAPAVLNELRLLSSARFDSRNLLSVVFAGDGRFTDKLRRDDLLPLGSRIRTRLVMEYARRDELLDCLKHLIREAGNPQLMTSELINTLCDHAAGNYRVLMGMAAELLATADERELRQLDEQLFLELYTQPKSKPRRAS